jgi:aminoglycoside phosphotransferase (APT) family kinase protein
MGSAGVLPRIAQIAHRDPALPGGTGPLRLRRAWPASATRLTLEYTSGDIVVAGHWCSEPGATRDVAAAAGDRMALVEVEGELVALQATGTDGRLPGLAAAAGATGARLVSHRAERRATIAVPGAFLKVVRPGRVAAVAAAHRAVHAVAAPAVLSEDERAGVLTLEAVPGRPLHDLLAEPGTTAAVRTIGAAVRRLHAQPPPGAACTGVHGPREEARVLSDWLERLAWHDSRMSARVRERARHVLGDLRALPAGRSALIHRDLHDKQILLGDDGAVGLIDLDTLTVGDPAIDLANLAAHFDLRARQAGADLATAPAQREALLAGYGASAAQRRRVEVYERAARLRLACVYAFRPRWAAVAAALAEDRERAA